MSVTSSGEARGLASLGHPATMLALTRQGFAGAVSGAFVFALLENQISADEASRLSQTLDPFSGLLHNIQLGVVFGGLVTALLVIADELSSGRVLRAVLRAVLACLVGAFVGSFASFIGGCVFGMLRVPAMLFGDSLFMRILARTSGWVLFGVGVGFSAGILSRSHRRTVQGCWGGAAGGFVGGFFFDIIAEFTSGGGHATVSRFVGFIALAACIGLATAVAEQLAKVAWLTFLTGAREGRQVVLHRDQLTLGRDELADVPLFGDMQVEKRHAEILLTPEPVIREVAGIPLLRLSGHPVREALLYDGAMIEIGRHRLRFSHRDLPSAPPSVQSQPSLDGLPASPWSGRGAGSGEPGRGAWSVERGASGAPAYGSAAPPQGPYPAPAPYAPPVYEPAPAPAAPYVLGQWTDASPDATLAMVPNGNLLLRVVAGPTAGTSVRLEDGMVTLGRESGNSIQLLDSKVSRYHARVEKLEGAWVLTDLNSTNGTRLNGLGIVRAGLMPGDQIGIGDAVIQVESGS